MKDIIDLFHSVCFKNNTKGRCKVYIDYDQNFESIYIGVAGENDWERPLNHWNDLLFLEREKDKNRQCCSIEGLSEKNARVLESFLILYGSKKYGLSHYNDKNVKPNTLINKRRERKYEKLIQKTLIINGNYDSSIIGREINISKR